MMNKNIDSNQNPSCLKEFEYLKWQKIELQCVLIINRSLSCIVVDANIVIIIVIGVNGPLYSVPKRMI